MKVGDMIVLGPIWDWPPRFGRILKESEKTYLVLEFHLNGAGRMHESYQHRWRKTDCHLANERVLKLLEEAHGLIRSYKVRIAELENERTVYLKPIIEAIRHEAAIPQQGVF